MRTFYSEYTQHCMRFYVRHPRPDFKSDVDKQNWQACDNALKSFSPSEIDIIKEVYASGDTIADNIYEISVRCEIKQDSIWNLMRKLEHKIAKRRKLI